MRVEVITTEQREELPLLIDADGLPVPSANEWLLTRRDKSANTLNRNLLELMPLFEWLEEQQIDLWQRISSGEGFTEAEIRGGLLELLRRDRSPRSVVKLSVAPDTYNKRLDTSAGFLKWMFSTCLSRLPSDHRSFDRIQANLDLILRWFSDGRMNPAPTKRIEKGLDNTQRNYLIKCLDPTKPGYDSYGKPLRRKSEQSEDAYQLMQALRYRNYAMTILLLFCGLRRGELLSLRVEDVVTGSAIPQVNVLRRGPDPLDERRPRPKVKRGERIVPLHVEWARRVDDYITDWRDVLLERAERDTDFLILSETGSPLSLSRMNDIYRKFRTAHSEKLPDHLSPHALRHTFSADMLVELQSAGLPEDEARRRLALLRGDSSEKSQDIYVLNELAKQASARLLGYQQNLSATF